MRRAASILLVIWAGSALVFGAIGAVAAPWELQVAFATPSAETALLNQYRFLRGVEMGAGLLFLVLRKEVLTTARLGGLFVGVAGLGATGRALSWAADGTPPLWVAGLLTIEASAAVAVALHPRGSAVHA